MIKTETKLKAWGNSIGIVLPKDEIQRERLSLNDDVEITIRKKSNSLREAFGILKNIKPKINKSTDQILKEIDKEFESRFD